jgi:hypothetical protein
MGSKDCVKYFQFEIFLPESVRNIALNMTVNFDF